MARKGVDDCSIAVVWSEFRFVISYKDKVLAKGGGANWVMGRFGTRLGGSQRVEQRVSLTLMMELFDQQRER